MDDDICPHCGSSGVETPIGKGATTLDYLRAAHPWLAKLLDDKDAEIKRLRMPSSTPFGSPKKKDGLARLAELDLQGPYCGCDD